MTVAATPRLQERLRDERHMTQGDGLIAMLETAAEAAASLDAHERLIGELTEYARAVTATLTEIAGGGSELFGRKIGEMYTADLAFCKERIRDREARAHERARAAIIELRELRELIAALNTGEA